MTDAGVVAVAVFFVAMGAIALLAPERIVTPFGTAGLTADGRNEVRAVYGGFGVAMGVLLVVALGYPALRSGVLLAVATALAGMAGGRLVAAGIERPVRFYPCWFYAVVEAFMAALLLAAVWRPGG